MIIVVVGCGALGLAVGSFLNVVIHRVPIGASVVSPASSCPDCGEHIRARHNVPVLSWVLLRGRCATCGQRISVRYPVIEALTGLVFTTVAVHFSSTRSYEVLPAYLYIAAVGIALAAIDFDVKRLPDAIVLPSYIVVAALLALASILGHDWSAFVRAGLGGLALYAFYFALAFVYPAGMGFGDVKLAGILGGVLAFLSWPTLAVGAFGAFVLGGIAGTVVIVSKRGTRKTAVPFGPFMITAAYVAIMAADRIWELYTGAMSV